jgi:hypothetical protein
VRLVHLTDTHLSFLPSIVSVERFGAYVRETFCPDHVVITGDVASYGSLARCLCQLSDGLQRPVSFVLGNHDVHGVSWREARDTAREASRLRPGLTYLEEGAIVQLASGTVLCGNDGWYDVRAGHRDMEQRASRVAGDLRWVADTASAISGGKKGIVPSAVRAQEYADKLVEESRRTILSAMTRASHVYFATHVPPFEQSAWHRSAPSDENWLPIMTCVKMGQMLSALALASPDKRITVLCGHTHSARKYAPLPNLTVFTGHSGRDDYNEPDVSNFFDLEPSS